MELGCRVEQIPMKYLGFTLGASASCASVWDEVMQIMEVKLATSKKKVLSKIGRLVLIKSCLACLAIYFFLFFIQMPSSVELKLTRLMRNFM